MKNGIIVIICLFAMSCKSKKTDVAPLAGQDTVVGKIDKRVLNAKEYEDSIAKVMEWTPLHDGLYISKFGDVAFKTAYVLDPPDFIETYRTKFCCDGDKPFKEVIDVETFRLLGGDWGWGGYFKDKNHIYHFFGNSGGGNLSILIEADHATFEIVNNCYGRDKDHIYDMRFGLMQNIDSKEFKILEYDNMCLGKYKNKYYWGNEELSSEDLAAPGMKEAIKQFNKL